MSSDSTPPYKSSLQELKLPPEGFQSTIPKHLLENIDPQTLWLLEEVSKNTAATEFACRAAVEHNSHLRELNGRTRKNEQAVVQHAEEVELLKRQIAPVAKVVKPISQFAGLWEFKIFRWIFILGLLFVALVLYPYYLTHPLSQMIEMVGRFIP